VEALAQSRHVRIADVPAVLAKVRRDPIGTRALARQRRLDRIRLIRPARLPDRRHVIDVDVQPLMPDRA
jgi:hypothetical protein